jgi:uncharacterized protein
MLYFHSKVRGKAKSPGILKSMIESYNIELIAIGNGTASRENDALSAKRLPTLEKKPVKVIISESGASVYIRQATWL